MHTRIETVHVRSDSTHHSHLAVGVVADDDTGHGSLVAQRQSEGEVPVHLKKCSQWLKVPDCKA